MHTESESLSNQLEIINQVFHSAQEDLVVLRQHRLLDESDFLTFAEQLDIPSNKHVLIDSMRLVRELVSAETSSEPRQYHPFRLYPLHRLVTCCERGVIRISTNQDAEQAPYLKHYNFESLYCAEEMSKQAEEANGIANLAILLEPIFWPFIVGQRLWRDDIDRLEAFRINIVSNLLQKLDSAVWQRFHEQIRMEAFSVDDNHELYLFLRLSKWGKPKRGQSGLLQYRQGEKV